jgi:TonB family protein
VCGSYLKSPRAPSGHVVVFKGSKRTDYNVGYLVEETVDNIAVKKNSSGEFIVTDRYYNDGEGGGPAGYKQRSYLLRLIATNEIEEKVPGYPGYRLFRCPASNSEAIERQLADLTSAEYLATEPYATIGNWKISMGRFRVWCESRYRYDGVNHLLISGDALDKLNLTVEVERKLFAANLDAEPVVEGVELVLDGFKKENLKPYGFRGTPGVLTDFDSALSIKFLHANALKLAERGSAKLEIRLDQSKEMLNKLEACLDKMRTEGTRLISQQLSWREYKKGLLEWVKKFKHSLDNTKARKALVRIDLSRDGRILRSEISETSGSEAFDREALSWLSRAQPLPAFPPEIDKGSATLWMDVVIEPSSK